MFASSLIEIMPAIPSVQKGRLRIYFGYAAGVGKTYQMLADATDMAKHGADVVIGFLDPQAPDNDAGKELPGIIPPLRLATRTGSAEEMDVEAILRRRPQVCLVDELAHSNAAGSARAKRWEDVQVLLNAAIDVLTTMNVQDLASLSDQIWQITGLHIRETVPDWVFQQAGEVVMVDVTPRALLHRLERGAVHAKRDATGAPAEIYREHTLVALRELAIRQTAQALEARQEGRGAQTERGAERILVHVSANPATAVLLRRARRVADYLHATCIAVFVHSERSFSSIPERVRQAVERHLQFAAKLQIETVVLQDKDPARALVELGRQHDVTQLFLSRPAKERRWWFAGLDFTDRVVQQARDLEVTVIAEPVREGHAPSAYPEDEAGAIMHSGFVRLPSDVTVDEAIGEVRRQAANFEMIHYAYVLDDSQHLLGVVSFRDLLSAQRTRRVQEIMRKDYLSIPEDMDQREVARLLAQKRLLAVPVLNPGGHMVGIVSSNDIISMVQQAASETIQKIGGMEALEGPYLSVSFRHMVQKRAGWLAILFVGEMLTATAMGYFSDEVSRAVVLALFLPLIISSGGNSGSQATTLVIRAMAVGELNLRDWWRVVGREVPTGLALGVILGVIGISRILVWQGVRGTYGTHYLVIAATIGCSLVGVVLFGTLAGSMLPFVLRRCGLDPASASAPFVATLVDVTGLIIYFTVASIILRGTVL
jgi:magnesium transporter